jgi:hypothetical protein
MKEKRVQTMKLVLIGIGFWFASTTLHAATDAGPVQIVENGQPLAGIFIAGEPARMTRRAAEELQTYIEKISGAVLPIVIKPSGGAVRIYVGISPHTETLGLDTRGLQHGAYRMASGTGLSSPCEPTGGPRGGSGCMCCRTSRIMFPARSLHPSSQESPARILRWQDRPGFWRDVTSGIRPDPSHFHGSSMSSSRWPTSP